MVFVKPVRKSYGNLFVPSQSIEQLAKRSEKPETLLEILLHGGVSVDDLRKWLDDGRFDVNERDAQGRVPLMSKVHTHDVYIEILLEKGADCTAVDRDGNSVLMYWIKSSGINDEQIESLLLGGADINASNKKGFTAMDIAIFLGIDLIPLLKHGAKWTPIPRIFIDKLFLAAADPFKYSCEIPLLKQFMKYLFHDGVPSPQAWEECLREVSSYVDFYDWLLQQYETFYKEEALEFQKSFAPARPQKEPQKNEESVRRKKSNYGYGLAGVLAMIRKKDYESLESLQKKNIHPDLGVHFDESSLQFQDEDGQEVLPPLMCAIDQNDTRAVKILLDAGANPTTGVSALDYDDTGVACAIRNNNMEILQMLIDAKADLNFAIRCNRTPVITAAEKNNLPALVMLVNAGANPVLKDCYHRIPLDFISEQNEPEAYRYLAQFTPNEDKK